VYSHVERVLVVDYDPSRENFAGWSIFKGGKLKKNDNNSI
jgi:hypothetical protein